MRLWGNHVMIFNINQNQLPATGGWGRQGEEKSKQSHSGLPEMRGGKKKITAAALLVPLLRTGLCQKRGASVPRFLETSKLGLAGPPLLQVNQLNWGGQGEILVSIPSLSLIPTPPPPPLTSLGLCTPNPHPKPAKVT